MHQHSKKLIEGLKVRVLKILLVVGTCALVGFWTTELFAGVIGTFDLYAYPFLIVTYSAITFYLFRRPDHLKGIEIATISILALYFVITHWMYFLNPETASFDALSYQQARIVQWYILIFIAAFVFFEEKPAIYSSIVFYLALAVPEIWFLIQHGSERSNEVTAVAVVALISNPVYIVCLWGVSLLKEHAHEVYGRATIMAEAAAKDALTGVLNRRGMADVVAEFKQDERNAHTPCALILFDIDHFKKINDTHGHDRGDDTLIAIAKLTGDHLRASDALARWGGEEFLIIAPELDLRQGQKLAERLRADLVACKDGVLDEVTASYGVSVMFREDDFETVLQEADKALYGAKSAGRNGVVIANK